MLPGGLLFGAVVHKWISTPISYKVAILCDNHNIKETRSI